MDEGTILKRMSRLRNEKNMSLESLEFICGLSAPALSKIERGKTKLRIEHIQMYAKALEVSAEYLILGYDPHAKQDISSIFSDSQAKYGSEKDVSPSSMSLLLDFLAKDRDELHQHVEKISEKVQELSEIIAKKDQL